MTLQEILLAIKEHENSFVQITLNDSLVVKCVLNSAYPGHLTDPRGYTERYLFVDRIDKQQNLTEKFNCSEILSIKPIN